MLDDLDLGDSALVCSAEQTVPSIEGGWGGMFDASIMKFVMVWFRV